MTGLFGSATLEVVVGLAFVYFLLSIICSAVNELIANVTRLRARFLKYGIQNLLCDPGLANAILSHPLITSSGVGPKEMGTIQRLGASIQGAQVDMPSYIPSDIFTLALFDSLVGPGEPVTVEAIRKKALELAASVDERAKSLGVALVRLIDSAQVVNPDQTLGTLDALKKAVTDLANSPETPQALDLGGAKTLADIRQAVMSLPDSRLREKILNFMTAQQVSLDAASRNIERWFDNAMSHVSGAYKARVQIFLLGIALVVTVGIGADSLAMFDSLSSSPSLRAVVVAEAQQAVQQGQPPQDITAQPAYQTLKSLGLPFGYSDASAQLVTPNRWTWLWQKIAGLVITTLAVSMGAPFWFDVLSKVSNLRAANKPAEKAGGG